MNTKLHFRLYFKPILILIVSVIVFADESMATAKPQDCKWSAWVDHGCSATCGEHIMRTKKRLKLQEAKNGGKNCRGATTRRMPCNFPECENLRIPDDFTYPDNTEDNTILEYSEELEEGSTDDSVNVSVGGHETDGDLNDNQSVSVTDRSNTRITYKTHPKADTGTTTQEPPNQNGDLTDNESVSVTDRSNARIDYESYPEADTGDTTQKTSNQRAGKDLKPKTNSCSPNCKSCKSITTRATDKWCLLECTNPGASRCLSAWCECS